MSSPAPQSADRLMARSGKTFYRAAGLLPRAVRGEVVALYAFCRRVDDLADEPAQPVATRARLLDGLAAAFAMEDMAVLRAAGWPFAPSGRLACAARLLVLAGKGDLRQVQPADEDALLAYAFGVAGTVGVMMVELLGARAEGAGAAVALGMAMQLSNIARDVAEDLQQGRVYLPALWVDREDVAAAMAGGAPRAEEAVRHATRQTLALAERLYAVAFDGVWTLPLRVRWSILAAALCYREIGRAVGRDVDASWRRRTVVPNLRKAWLIARAGLLLLTPRFWRGRTRGTRPVALGGRVVEQCLQLGVAL